MVFSIIFIIFILVIIFIFASPTLSPIPYFPSQKIDLPKIIKALNLRNDQIVFDLGAGDGIVIFRAAREAFKQKLNTQFVAVEINPVLILILNIRRLFHSNKHNIKIVHDDIFKMNFSSYVYGRGNASSLSTFYLYISPWFLEKVLSNIKNLTSNDYSVVSYMYPIKSLKSKERVIQGKNKIFIYRSGQF